MARIRRTQPRTPRSAGTDDPARPGQSRTRVGARPRPIRPVRPVPAPGTPRPIGARRPPAGRHGGIPGLRHARRRMAGTGTLTRRSRRRQSVNRALRATGRTDLRLVRAAHRHTAGTADRSRRRLHALPALSAHRHRNAGRADDPALHHRSPSSARDRPERAARSGTSGASRRQPRCYRHPDQAVHARRLPAGIGTLTASAARRATTNAETRHRTGNDEGSAAGRNG